MYPLRGPESNPTPIAISTLITQIFAPENSFPLKGTKVPWRNE